MRIEWEVPDANGDVAENSRSLVLNPKQPATRWLYGRLPPDEGEDLITLIRVFEERDGQRVRELASQRIKPGDAEARSLGVRIRDDLIAVIGSSRCGLEGYESLTSFDGQTPSLNTATVIARGIQPRDVPDRWEGLSGFQAIVWAEGSPAALTPESAQALRSWVKRGGHLVIILPEAGNPWAIGSASAHALSDLLPSVPPKRVDAVPVAALLPVLSKSMTLRNENASTPIQVFAKESLDRGFVPLLTLPCPRNPETGELAPATGSLEGAIVAVQSLVGHGRLTVVGIDVDGLNKRRLQASELPQADAFWNRILGRRGDTPTALEFQQWRDADPSRLANSQGNVFTVEGGLISGRIGLRGQVALGLLGVLVLFGSYWVIAGPLSWVVLGRIRRRHVAWMLFLVVAAGFTTVAWGASRLLSTNDVRLQHVTVLDWIARGPGEPPSDAPRLARATSWFSASLPGYGRTRVSVGGSPEERNLVGVWSPPPAGSSMTFPNPSRYEVPIEAPGSIDVPARATSCEFEAQWMGEIDPEWGTLPASEGAAPITPLVSWNVDPRLSLRGALSHRLPGTLTNVTVIHIQPYRMPVPRLVDPPPKAGAAPILEDEKKPPREIEPSGEPSNYGRLMSFTTWKPGEPLDVSLLYDEGKSLLPSRTSSNSLVRSIRDLYYVEIARSNYLNQANFSESQQLNLLNFYGMLQPPEYMARPEPQVAHVHRTFGRDLDLSPWSNRPCLIVVGYLQDSACPVPITIDDEVPESNGLTVVRCVIPLPVEESGLQPWQP